MSERLYERFTKSLFCSCVMNEADMNEADRVKVIVHSSAKCRFDLASIASKYILSLTLYCLVPTPLKPL